MVEEDKRNSRSDPGHNLENGVYDWRLERGFVGRGRNQSTT